MINFSSVMIGTSDSKKLGEFYEKVFEKKADMEDGGWYGWQIGNTFFNIGLHSEVKGKAKEPQRIILNLETDEVKEEFERIKKIEGATVIKNPYEISAEGEISPESGGQGAWIATLADPDGNYSQLMSPWEEENLVN